MIDRDDRQYITGARQDPSAPRQVQHHHYVRTSSTTCATQSLNTADSTPLSWHVLSMTNEIIITLDATMTKSPWRYFRSTALSLQRHVARRCKRFVLQRLQEVARRGFVNAERENLAKENTEYRNLLNEYRDGMLLFEISDRNVWTRSKETPKASRLISKPTRRICHLDRT